MMKEFVKRIAQVLYSILASRIIQPNAYLFFSSVWEVPM